MTILSNASVFTGFFSANALVEKEQVISGYNLIVVFPVVVGLGIGLGSAQDFLRGYAFFDRDHILRNFDILRRICDRKKTLVVLDLPIRYAYYLLLTKCRRLHGYSHFYSALSVPFFYKDF